MSAAPMPVIRRTAVRLFTAALLASSLFAQDYRGKVQGVVTDTSRAIVVGANVTLLNVNTGISAVRQTKENGSYLFDYVEPGSYQLTVELAGFTKFVQQNVSVQVRADLTVNALLSPGAVTEQVTVNDTPPPVQFNSSSIQIVIDRKMLDDMPALTRNPVMLAALDTSVVLSYGAPGTQTPNQMWVASSLNVGGTTTRQNDLLLDGTPAQIGTKGSYSPPMDSIQEFSVQQNSVDAEFGHSAGGIISMSMKSGTNEVHGTAYYFGRNPYLNAVTNAFTRSPSGIKNNIAGATGGGPIKKNKIFTYGAYEVWRTLNPATWTYTMPWEGERQGDFSQSRNGAGGLRTIYDPWTTSTSAAGAVSRQAFPGNIIPASRMDTTAVRMMKDIWQPNGPGDNQTHVNDYKVTSPVQIKYFNVSDRTDWNITDKWRIFGRFSAFRTFLNPQNFAGSLALPRGDGGTMNATNIAGESVYTLDARTVLSVRASFGHLRDDFDMPTTEMPKDQFAAFWPGNNWWQPYLGNLPVYYYPGLSIGGQPFGRARYWKQNGSNSAISVKASRDIGRHYAKVGFETRRYYSYDFKPSPMTMSFSAATTANTYVAPNTNLSGDPWATFLLGALDNSSVTSANSDQIVTNQYYGLYFHDDWKITPKLTVNLGLRYEYETPLREEQTRLSRYVDLTNPIPEMTKTPPAIPANVAAMMGRPYTWNGAWLFTDSENPYPYQTQKNVFIPRLGAAYALDQKTSVRFGFGRYIVPSVTLTDPLQAAIVDPPGFSASTNVAPMLQGVPGAVLSNPFPATNPLILPSGKTLGRYTNLGGAASWTPDRLTTPVNDRYSISVQRALPWNFVTEVDYNRNYGRNLPYSRNMNMADPQLSYTYKNQLSSTVANPFYRYLTPQTFPGALRNQASIAISGLLTPYPQYTALTQMYTPGIRDRYQAVVVRVRRSFASGLSYSFSYTFADQETYSFFNADDQFADRFTYQPATLPRHRMNMLSTWDIPVGRQRRFFSGMNPALDALAGGWRVTPMYTFVSGNLITFGQLNVNGDPRIPDPAMKRWFNTSVFSQATPFTPRTNPLYYDGLRGPKQWNLDLALAKYFRLPFREGMRFELRMEAYNLTNSVMLGMPNTTVTSSLFGQISSQTNLGRQFQYTGRIHF